MTETPPAATASSSDAMDHYSKAEAQSEVGKVHSNGALTEKDANDAPSSGVCPLFMDGLPSDFAVNAGLMAIAALIDDDGEKKEVDISKTKASLSTVHFKSGGGKVKKARKRNNIIPYGKQEDKDSDKKKENTSLGEAQLFLNMWKI